MPSTSTTGLQIAHSPRAVPATCTCRPTARRSLTLFSGSALPLLFSPCSRRVGDPRATTTDPTPMEAFVTAKSVLKRITVGALALALTLCATACAKGGSTSSNEESGGTKTISMWTHNAGNKNELAAINAIVNDYNASQTKYKVKVQAFPQDSYNQSVVAAAAAQEAALHPGHRRPERAELGLGRYLAPLDGHGRHAVQVPADTVGKYNDKNYSVRLLRRRAGHGHAASRCWRSTASAIPTIDQPWTEGRVHRGAGQDQGQRRVRQPAGHRDRRHRRVVAVRLLPVPAELRRRPDQPRPTTRPPTACSTGPQAVEWATWFRGLVDRRATCR